LPRDLTSESEAPFVPFDQNFRLLEWRGKLLDIDHGGIGTEGRYVSDLRPRRSSKAKRKHAPPTRAVDAMHVLHLGCYQYVFGSCLALLTHHHMPAAPEQNLEVIWGHIKQYYKDQKQH
jgi:hypothetical protein